MQDLISNHAAQVPWNKGIIMGQKPPLKRSQVWAIRVRLQISGQTRDLAMFNMGIDSKLRACDLVRLRVRDIGQGSQVSKRAIIMQRKTRNPVQFKITEQTRAAVHTLIVENRLEAQDYLFSSVYSSCGKCVTCYEIDPSQNCGFVVACSPEWHATPACGLTSAVPCQFFFAFHAQLPHHLCHWTKTGKRALQQVGADENGQPDEAWVDLPCKQYRQEHHEAGKSGDATFDRHTQLLGFGYESGNQQEGCRGR